MKRVGEIEFGERSIPFLSSHLLGPHRGAVEAASVIPSARCRASQTHATAVDARMSSPARAVIVEEADNLALHANLHGTRRRWGRGRQQGTGGRVRAGREGEVCDVRHGGRRLLRDGHRDADGEGLVVGSTARDGGRRGGFS